MKKLKCKCCGKEHPAEAVFVYEEKNYCFECASDLVYEMASNGRLIMEQDDMENKGVRLEW